MNRPNYITLIRIALVPLTLVMLFSNWPYHDFITAGLVLFAWVTDFLDGVLARRTDAVSNLGIYLDAAADKIVVLCVLFNGLIKIWANQVFLLQSLTFGHICSILD